MSAAFLLLAWCMMAGTPAAGRSDDAWAGYLVEVTCAYRQDPPRQLLETRTEIEKALAATSGEKERLRLESSLKRVRANIDEDTGSIVLGWACKVNDDGLRIDGRTSMAGFFVAARRANNEIASKLKPGDCLLVPRRGLEDLHASGGRRYRVTQRIKATARPSWHEAPVGLDPPLAIDAESTKHAETAFRFQHVKEREGGRLYRFTLRTTIVDAPADADHAKVRVAIHLHDTRGVPLGPLLTEAKPKRTQTGLFAQSRSWEILVPDRVKLDVDSVSTEIQAVAFVEG